jgi:hypothetical protein
MKITRKGAKRLTREQILGETAVQFIGRRFLDMGFPWHPTNAPLDAGIDGGAPTRDMIERHHRETHL